MRYVSMLFGIVMLALSATAAGAALPAGPPQRIALLLGNSDYDGDGQMSTLPTGRFERDLPRSCKHVDQIKAKLAAAGFTVIPHCNLSQTEFEAAVDAFQARTADLPTGSIAFVYYAGHGSQFLGNPFLLPVKFQEEDGPDAINDAARLKYYRRNASELSYLFERMPEGRDVVVVMSLDNCRNNPVGENTLYNEQISIRARPNMLVQYSTSAGDTAPDDDSYANALSAELVGPRDVRTIMTRVGTRIMALYDSGRRTNWAETFPGPRLPSMPFIPLRAPGVIIPRPIPVPTPVPTRPPADSDFAQPPPRPQFESDRRPLRPPAVAAAVSGQRSPRPKDPITYRPEGSAGTKLTIFWCEYGDEARNYAFAQALARAVVARAGEFGVGRVNTRFLSDQKNFHAGFNVRTNLMRYDPTRTAERALLVRLSVAFPDGAFLPQPGKGHGGSPTSGYVSAFVCGAQPDLSAE